MPNGNGTNGNGKRQQSPRITKPRFLKALVGSGGVKSLIAERLGCGWNAVHEYLKRCKERRVDIITDAFEDECNRVGDLAEDCVNKVIGALPVDPETGSVVINEGPLGNTTQAKLAVDTSKWYLSRKRKEEFGDRQTMVHEGGETPIEVKSDVVLDLEKLPLPLKKALLEHLKEKKE